VEIEKVKRALPRIAHGVEKYQSLIERIQKTDVTENTTFQINYNDFFKMRQRPQEYYREYYRYMQQQKDNGNLTFEAVLNHFYAKFGRVEASFSSKLLSMINPNMPVWDKFVISNLGLTPPSYAKPPEERIRQTIKIYAAICKWYDDFMKTDEVRAWIELFDQKYPNSRITDVKKIDLILWQTRE